MVILHVVTQVVSLLGLIGFVTRQGSHFIGISLYIFSDGTTLVVAAVNATFHRDGGRPSLWRAPRFWVFW
jgi:hypothetical protein